ncbi:hypothetical protein AYJ54_11160 [Bradyrhizobium centrolobii]|uniref:Major facilitator superfamily (MFS) profile domain-containing protein n=1 Tax=Bradyrhizobium centrolobii TaxID=1505087 RepID=A0A176YSP3_9BRAD|nr:MFS transporter [Bradyrhizobium centrolobii]OAF10233.1 hypothetical protein AYJ54_11160 [Bradyrhizobium centrolobii]
MSSSQQFPTPATGALLASHRRLVVAAVIGNLLEWYDFFVYGVLAVTIAKLFFPAQSELTSLLLTLVSYGSGVVVRPFGAIMLGLYADRVGRKAALCLALATMGLGTGLIAIAPTFEAIGIAAPLIIVVARLLQGFSGSGELGSSVALLVEAAPDRWRGLYASFNEVSSQIGFLLAAFIVMIINLAMTPAQIDAGGWRVPFVFGLLVVPIGIYMRSKLEEPAVLSATRDDRTATKAAGKSGAGRPLLFAVGILLLYAIAGNVLFVYMPTFAVHELKIPTAQALFSSVAATCVMILCTPVVAFASDHFGRKPLFLLAAAGFLMLTYPAYAILTNRPSAASLAAVQAGLAVLMAVYAGPLKAALAELFPRRIRVTGVGFAYSLTAMIGSFAPAFATWLIAETANARAPAFIVMVAGVASGLALVWFKDEYGESLV